MDVEYTPNSSVSNLHIKDVEVTDEGLYKCEKTYLEVRENCDVVQVIKLRTLGKSSVVKPTIYSIHLHPSSIRTVLFIYSRRNFVY